MQKERKSGDSETPVNKAQGGVAVGWGVTRAGHWASGLEMEMENVDF